jgi:glycosyltransferase involved in cell wall biosynthesis
MNYALKEYIIVLNTVNCDVNSVKSEIEQYDNVKLIVMHQENNIGKCLNKAISHANGALWFKIDDDDVYGPNYIIDYIHSYRESGAVILGKSVGYMYIESKDALYLRKIEGKRSHFVTHKKIPHLCGATICGVQKSTSFIPFSEDLRSCVDSIFFEQAIRQGLSVHFTDEFNFIAFRAKDKSHHTWRYSDDDLTKKALFIGTGTYHPDVIF